MDNKLPEPNISRRGFNGGVFSLALMGIMGGVQSTAANTLDISPRFLAALNNYEGGDNHISGNQKKYDDLALPLIEAGLDNPDNMEKLRILIEREIAIGYKKGVNPDYNTFNKETRNDHVFFGSIRDTSFNDIHVHDGATYDNRIKGKLDFGSPEGILASVKNRIEEQESNNIAFVIKDQNGVNIFVYYENGKLKYLLPTSPGTSILGRTPGNMKVPTDEELEKVQGGGQWPTQRTLANYYQDDLYKNTGNLGKDGKKGGAMPYSRRLLVHRRGDWKYAGHNTHIGKVTGKEASHGCIRQGALGAYLLFYGLKPGTMVYYRPELHLPNESS